MASLNEIEKIGNLDRWIVIYTSSEGGKTFAGEPIDSISVLAETWAKKDYKSGAELEESDRDTVITNVVWIIRFDEAEQVNEKDWIVDEHNKIYDIVNVQEMGRGRFLKLITKNRE